MQFFLVTARGEAIRPIFIRKSWGRLDMSDNQRLKSNARLRVALE